MDKPSDVNLSSTDASVSNIPTATPIASEIISDFEPDPKFEITPLEKATFDCNDLLLQDSNLSELVQHSENGDQQGENGANKLEKEQVSQDSGVHNPTNKEVDEPAGIASEVDANSEPKPKEDSQTISSHIRGDSEMLTPSSNDIPKINDCPSSFDKNENDADHLTATISLDESIAATALVEVAERADALGSHNMKESDHNRQQYSAITTSQQTGQVQTNEGNDVNNFLFSNSQTSVDALRDKVIESALELGEAHDFSHAPIQVEDREKLFESIHREVTSIQSSIDLIADVASQQQSIEINPVLPQKQAQQQVSAEPSFDRSTPRQDTDLITEKQLSSPSKEDAQSSEPQIEENSDKKELIEEAPALKEAEKAAEKIDEEKTAKPSEEIVCETIHASEVDEGLLSEVPETQVEPIIEEPPVASDVDASSVHEEREQESEKTKEDLADIIVEPLESADEAVEQLNLQPVVEEASSADEQEQSDNIVEAKPAEQEEVTAKDVSIEMKDKAETVESIATEEPVGRSSRSLRTRVPKRKLDEEIPAPEPPKKQVKRSRLSSDQLNKSTAPPRGTSIIKLPALKSRMTISTSDPSSRPGAHRERAAMAAPASDKKYVCKECGFGTDRLDNIVYHNTKSFCQGKSVMAEMMKNDIIKQQQSKGRRKQPR